MKANERKPLLHNEGDHPRNWTPYNFQTLRDDVFMLAGRRHHRGQATVAGPLVLRGAGRLAERQREWVYSQQQTISAEGFSGHAFSTFVPHTVRATETKTAPTATSRRPTTTTPSWPRCSCRARTTSTSSAASPRWPRAARAGGRGGHRARGAAGGHRQLPAQAGLSRRATPKHQRGGDLLRDKPSTTGAATCSTSSAATRCSRSSSAASTSTRPTARAASAPTTSRRSTRRDSRSRSSPRRCRRSASGST